MKNIIIKFGLILAVSHIILSLLYYKGLLGSSLHTSLLLMLCFTIISWLTARQIKASHDGFAPFGLIFKTLFLIMIFGIGIATISNQMYASFIMSEDEKQAIIDRQIENQISNLEWLGVSQYEIDKQLEDLEKTITIDSFTDLKTIILGFVMIILFGLIFGLILAAIFKKNPPKDLTEA